MEAKSSTDKLKRPQASARERDRIKVLRQYAVLDTEPEQEFDDLAAMAAHICGTPIALISLVDNDRQWFKSKIGLNTSETPRSQSFCAHALDQPHEVFTVEDAAQDQRFFDNPLVTGEPGIRFYAGAPLLTPDDSALGTICVIDRVPRLLTPTQLWMLQTLSRQVVRKLEARLMDIKLDDIHRLPPGLHDLGLDQLQSFFCTSPVRWALWLRLLCLLARPILDPRFSHAYISGVVLSSHKRAGDVEVTLETAEPFEICGYAPFQEYFANGRERIHQLYSIHLRFWIENLPANHSEHHSGHASFFAAEAPWKLPENSQARVVRLDLRDPAIMTLFRRAMDPFHSY